VRTIIQNTKTGMYLREGEWTADRSLARSFGNVDEAVHYRFQHVLKAEMRVIFQPGDGPSEWDVTVAPQ
jgi:hypothetical protein